MALVSFQLLNSHLWSVATILHSTDIGYCQTNFSTFSIVQLSWPISHTNFIYQNKIMPLTTDIQQQYPEANLTKIYVQWSDESITNLFDPSLNAREIKPKLIRQYYGLQLAQLRTALNYTNLLS